MDTINEINKFIENLEKYHNKMMSKNSFFGHEKGELKGSPDDTTKFIQANLQK